MLDKETMKRFESLLAAYVDGALEDERVPEFVALLEEEGCQQALEDDLMMDARLAQFENVQGAGRQFVGKVLATLEAEARDAGFVEQVVGRAARESTMAGILRFWPVLVAAMFVVGLLLGQWLGHEAVPISDVEPEQVAAEEEAFVALLANEAGAEFAYGKGPEGGAISAWTLRTGRWCHSSTFF